MKFATETYGRAKLPDERAGQVLFEALPWIKNITGKTVVIKSAARPWRAPSCVPTS